MDARFTLYGLILLVLILGVPMLIDMVWGEIDHWREQRRRKKWMKEKYDRIMRNSYRK